MDIRIVFDLNFAGLLVPTPSPHSKQILWMFGTYKRPPTLHRFGSLFVAPSEKP
jgi:hypothetical protein